MNKTFDEQWVIGKIYPFEDRVFENKNLFVFGQDRLFKVIKLGECISNDIVFTRDKMDVWGVLFNIIEPANDTVRRGIIGCNVKVIGV